MHGAFLTSFFIIFREALEASLIVGIILTLLVRLNQRQFFPHVMISVACALGASLLVGFGLLTLTANAQSGLEKILEGLISLIACAVLTYMVFWMDKQSKNIRPEIEYQLEKAISRSEYFTIISLPFLAVFREGAETVLFLSAIAAKNSQAISLLGSFSGLLLAVGIVMVIFWGGRRIPLKPLFRISGIFLLLIAAGLLAYGIHELQEIGWIPEIYAPIWNINHILNEKEGIGALLKAILGYNGNPSLIEFTSYLLYLLGIYIALKKRPEALPSKAESSS